MEEQQHETDPVRRKSGLHPAILAAAAAACVAFGVFLGAWVLKPGGGGTPVPAALSEPETADSEAESAGSPFEIEEVAEVPSEPEPDPEQVLSAEALAEVIAAAVPHVGHYAAQHLGRGHVICIDPGHQDHEMTDTEPNAPGSSVMKAKLTSGTQGVATGNTEYEINLEIGLLLRDILKSEGYRVVMTRESNDVNISNAERAQLAASAGAELFIRLHCNGSSDSGASGVVAYQPSSSNPYLPQDVIAGSQKLASLLCACQTSSTGQRNLGVIPGDDMTGINWAQMPVSIIEMGYMSNPEEDRYLGSPEGQKAVAEGLAGAVNAYFAEPESTEGS